MYILCVIYVYTNPEIRAIIQVIRAQRRNIITNIELGTSRHEHWNRTQRDQKPLQNYHTGDTQRSRYIRCHRRRTGPTDTLIPERICRKTAPLRQPFLRTTPPLVEHHRGGWSHRTSGTPHLRQYLKQDHRHVPAVCTRTVAVCAVPLQREFSE